MKVTDKDLIFVARAVNRKDNKRAYIKGLHVEGGKVYGTDGCRMHWCNTDLPDGEYRIDKQLKRELHIERIEEPDFRYPDVHRVIPERTNETETYFYLLDVFNNDQYRNSWGDVCKLVRNLPDEDNLNLGYITDLEHNSHWKVSFHKHLVMATDDGGKQRGAVIATMRNY